MIREYATHQEAIDLLAYWRVLTARKGFLAACVGFCTIIAAVASLFLPNMYRATAVILPLSNQMASFGGMAAELTGIPFVGNLLSSGNPNGSLMALLQSQSLAEEVIRKNDLLRIFYAVESGDQKHNEDISIDDAISDLQGMMIFTEERKTGTIIVSCEYKDPQIAAQIANSYLSLLQEMISQKAFTGAKRNRQFVAHQLSKHKRALLEAGKSLNLFYHDENVSNVRSKIDVSTVFDPSELPQSHAWGRRVAGLRSSEADQLVEGDAVVGMVKDVPQQVYLEYTTLHRDMMARLTELLAQKYEIAKIEESREELAYQVIDPAKPPKRRFKPKRRNIVFLAFALSSMIAVFSAFGLEYIAQLRHRTKGSIAG